MLAFFARIGLSDSLLNKSSIIQLHLTNISVGTAGRPVEPTLT